MHLYDEIYKSAFAHLLTKMHTPSGNRWTIGQGVCISIIWW